MLSSSASLPVYLLGILFLALLARTVARRVLRYGSDDRPPRGRDSDPEDDEGDLELLEWEAFLGEEE